MKFTKLLCLLLVLLTVVFSVACGGKDEDKGPDFFELKEIPQGSVSSALGVGSRLNESFTDEPSIGVETGELLPFVGGFYTYTEVIVENEKDKKDGETKTPKQVSLPLYGLCTEQGAVVVDAVYDAVKKHVTDEGSFIYELVKGADGSDDRQGERFLLAVDGSWGFAIPKTHAYGSAGGDLVTLIRKRTQNKVDYYYHDFYDHSGKRVFTFDNTLAETPNIEYTIGAFSDGLAPVNVTIKKNKKPEAEKTEGEKAEEKTEETLENEDKTYGYYINVKGEKVSEDYIRCGEFENGYAVIEKEKGKVGVLTPKGEWFIEPKYREINYNAEKGLFACGDEGFFDILNMEKKSQKKILCDRGSVEILGFDTLIYKKVNADTKREEYYYFETGEPFSCVETGQFPDGEGPVEGLYVCTYTGTGTIFDENGETVAGIGDFGQLVERFGNTCVITNATDHKVCFVTVSNKQRFDWLRYKYLRQSIGGRYLCLQSSALDDSSFALYDIYTNEFVFTDADYISVSQGQDVELLSVVNGQTVTVYNKKLEPVLVTKW